MKQTILSIFLLLLLSCNSYNSEEEEKVKKAVHDSIELSKKEKEASIVQAIKQKEDSIKRIIQEEGDSLVDSKKQKLLPSDYKSWITDDFNTKFSFSLTNKTDKTIDVVIFSVSEKYGIVRFVDENYKYIKESSADPFYHDYRMSIKRIITPKNKTNLTLEFKRERDLKIVKVTIEKLHYTDGTVSGNY